jgi:hypothetical protein
MAADTFLCIAIIVLERSSISRDSTRKRNAKVFIPISLFCYILAIPFHIFFFLIPDSRLLIKSFFNLFEFSHAAIVSPMNLPGFKMYIPTSLFQIIPPLHIKEFLATWILVLVAILLIKKLNGLGLSELIRELGILNSVIYMVVKDSALNKSELKRISVNLVVATIVCSFISYFIIPPDIYFVYFKYIVFLWFSLFICVILYNNDEDIRKSRKSIIYFFATIIMVLYFLKVEGEVSTATKGLFLVISLILLFDRILNSYFELKEDVLEGKDPIFCFLYFSESDFDNLKRHITKNKDDYDIKDQLNLGMCYLFGSEKDVIKAGEYFKELIERATEDEENGDNEESDQIYSLIAYLYAKCIIENKNSNISHIKNGVKFLNELKEYQFYKKVPMLVPFSNILIIDALASLGKNNHNKILLYCKQNKYLVFNWYLLPSRQIYLLAKSLAFTKEYDKAKRMFRKYCFDPQEYNDVNYLTAFAEINSEKPDVQFAMDNIKKAEKRGMNCSRLHNQIKKLA